MTGGPFTHRSVGALLLGGLGIAGCQGTEALPLPPEAQAALLVRRDGAAITRVLALEGPFIPDQVLRDDVRLSVGLYSSPLEELRIAPGEIDWEDREAPLAPEPASELILEFPWKEWRTPESEDSPFPSLRVPRRKLPCEPPPAFQAPIALTGSSTSGPVFWTRRSGHHSYLGNEAGIWDVGPGTETLALPSTTTSTLAPPGLLRRPILALYEAVDGFVYAYQRGGAFWKADPGKSFMPLGVAPGAQLTRRAWMAGSREMAAFQTFILDDQGGMWRYADEGWSPVRPPNAQTNIGREGGVAWLSPDNLAIAGLEPGHIDQLEQLNLRSLNFPGGAVTVMDFTLAIGLTVGDDAGRVWRKEGQTWAALTEGPGPPVRGLGNLENRFVLYGTNEPKVYFVGGASNECRFERPLPAPFLGTLVTASDSVIVASGGPSGEFGPVYLIRYQRR